MAHHEVENNVLDCVTPSSDSRKKTDSAIYKLKEKINTVMNRP